jgi:predicted dienelactone hydrolase
VIPGATLAVGLHFFFLALAFQARRDYLTLAVFCLTALFVPLAVPLKITLGPLATSNNGGGWMVVTGMVGLVWLWLVAAYLLVLGGRSLREIQGQGESGQKGVKPDSTRTMLGKEQGQQMSETDISQGKEHVLVSIAQNKSKRTRKRIHRIRKIGLTFLVIVFLLSFTLFLGVTSGLIGIHFPQLTGAYAVGRINYDLLDASRQEPFLNNPHARREIMVTVYYPAAPPTNAHPAPYLEGTMADLLASKVHLPAVAIQLIHAHAYEGVPIAQGSFPVVLFSPGIGTPPVEYTSMVEDVASHGYIVAMIYPTYSVPFTVFADGRVALLNQAGIRSENEPTGTSDAQTNKDRNAIGSVWVADARFTLDQLTKLNSDDKLLKGHLNLEAVGMFGHSFGGATTAEVCQIDTRFKACINMDGTAFTMTSSSQIKQPFMWMASDYSQVTDSQLQQVQLTRREFNAKMQQRNTERETFVQGLSQGYVFLLKGSTHSTYITDEALLGPVVPGLGDPLATIDGVRAVTVINAYVSTFFDTYLKQQQTDLLNGDSPRYPDVELSVDHNPLR